jgi:hypothetical protein
MQRLWQKFETTSVDVPGDGIAWGQYLDEEHFSPDQWGFYGTTAALQTLALSARRRNVDPYGESTIARAISLPETRTTQDEIFTEKRAKGDFDSVVKLTFIADALKLDAADSVALAETPALVRELMDMAVSGRWWSTRPQDDPARFNRDRDFPTAFVVAVLRRYEVFRRDPLWRASRNWLASRVLDDSSFREQTTLLALTGLALRPFGQVRDESARVNEALDACEARLLAWIRDQHAIVLTRPVFNGFSLGPRNDYVFLHPELLVALFLIERDSNPHARRFVLDVLDALTRAIMRRDAFMGQDGIISSVDQLWAGRLLFRFLQKSETRSAAELVPNPKSLISPQTSRGVAAWLVVLIAISLVIGFMLQGSAGIGIAILGLIAIVIQRLL